MRTAGLLLAASLAGCLGGYRPGTPEVDVSPDPPPGPASAAQAQFIEQVQPFVSTQCAACHAADRAEAGPRYLGTAGVYYGQLVSDARFVSDSAAASQLITHVHLTGPGQGSDMTASQAMAVSGWIAAEARERTLPGAPASPMVAVDELEKFAGCMTFADYQASGMSEIWTTNTTEGTCNVCHQNGEHAVTLGQDASRNFAALAQLRELMRLASAEVKPAGRFGDILSSKRLYERGQETGHPQYPAAQVQAAVEQFFQLSYARYKAGGCVSPSPSPSPLSPGGQ